MRTTVRRIKVAAAVSVVVVAAALLVRAVADTRPEAADAASALRTTPTSWAPAVPVAEARQLLADLQVADRGPLTGYDREKFRHWISQGDRCNTREVVLARDGTNVKAGADCAPTVGSWTSPYDGDTWTRPSDVDIEHVVPLAHAWVSGANLWTAEQRKTFANDLVRPQLFVVTDNVNQSKGDQAPDEWVPPLESAWCTYGTDWTVVKHFYQLTVTTTERSALAGLLDQC